MILGERTVFEAQEPLDAIDGLFLTFLDETLDDRTKKYAQCQSEKRWCNARAYKTVSNRLERANRPKWVSTSVSSCSATTSRTILKQLRANSSQLSID